MIPDTWWLYVSMISTTHILSYSRIHEVDGGIVSYVCSMCHDSNFRLCEGVGGTNRSITSKEDIASSIYIHMNETVKNNTEFGT